MQQQIWLVHPEEEMCAAFRSRFASLPNVCIFRRRFEDLDDHDCFVTAGNSFGLMTAGVDAAVVRYFGEELMLRVQQHILDQFFGEQPVGTAFVVATGHTNIPFLVHAPTMRVPNSINGTDKVYAATWSALLAVRARNLLDKRQIKVISFPALGTGFGCVPFDEAARQMAVAYRHFLTPPRRLDWEAVAQRHKAICYDGTRQVVH